MCSVVFCLYLFLCVCRCDTAVRWKGLPNSTSPGETLVAELYDVKTGKLIMKDQDVFVFSPRYGGLSKAFCSEGVRVKTTNGTRKCTVSFGWIAGKGTLYCALRSEGQLVEQVHDYDEVSFTIGKRDWLKSPRTWSKIIVSIFLCVFGLIAGIFFVVYVLCKGQGNKAMLQVAGAIRRGSYGFMRTQYLGVAIVSVVIALLIFVLFCFRPEAKNGARINKYAYGAIVAATFLFGVACSALAGAIAMYISVNTNSRVACAATRTYGESVRVALSGGGFCSYVVNSFAVGGLTFLILIIYLIPKHVVNALQTAELMVGFSFGAAFSGLFAQLGGGIFTKSADIGADLVGKTVHALEEDDIRNPAVVADLVGDNVGDCAGRSADLFETMVSNVIAVIILGTSLAYKCYPELPADRIYDMVLYPVLMLGFGMVASFFGILTMAGLSRLADFPVDIPDIYAADRIAGEKKEEEDVTVTVVDATPEGSINRKDGEFDEPTETTGLIQRRGFDDDGDFDEDVLVPFGEPVEKKTLMMRLTEPNVLMLAGFIVTFITTTITTFIVNIWCFYDQSEKTKYAWLVFSFCGVIGILISFLIAFITFFYTDYVFCPVRLMAKSAHFGGAATNIISGTAYGLQSTLPSAAVIGGGMLFSFWLGKAAGYYDENLANIGGMYGVAAATLGMIATCPFILCLDTFGPIADNAGGIVEMSGLPEEVRAITDKLDAVGNTVKALTKSYAMAIAVLAAVLVVFAFLDLISNYTQTDFYSINIASPEVIFAALCGGVTVFIFVAVALQATSNGAVKVMNEVRSQFAANPDILDPDKPDALPDYTKVVAKCTRIALLNMMVPGLIGIVSPVLVGFVFRLVGFVEKNPMMGVQAGTAFLVFSTITNVLMGVFLTNSGGAWDNAKKLVETGAHGGKHTDTHNAVIVGDTVGDPFKDTAGPSLNILVTLVATATLVIGPLWIDNRIIHAV